jgi:hypothetical protein
MNPGLALTLLVTRVAANDANHAFAADNLAVLAQFLNGRSNFHKSNLVSLDAMQHLDKS